MKLTYCALLAIVLGGSTVHAEETVHWDDLAKLVKEPRPDRSREYTVVIKTGKKKKMRELVITPSGLTMEPHITTPSTQILEIQVRHRGRLSYFGWVEDKFRCGPDYGCLFDPIPLLVSPLDLVVGVVTTPPLLVVEGSRRLAPARILKIVP